MQNSNPQKILGKKFVRGKPYYKVKWEGVSKQQSSWQSPASLKHFKSMINKFEIKNWGIPLDEKFFDPEMYASKGFAPKKRTHDKKKSKQLKKMAKRKIEEGNSDEESSGHESSQDEGKNFEQETRQLEKKQAKLQFEQLSPKIKAFPKQRLEDIQIIDLDNASILHQRNTGQETQKAQIHPNCLIFDENSKLINKQVNVPNISQNSFSLPQIQMYEKENPAYRDLGLAFPCQLNTQPTKANQSQKPQKIPQKQKNLTMHNAICLEIEPLRTIKQIVHIYHLEKVNLGNHLYLVQFENREMAKMTTEQMLMKHPEELVSFLEMRFKNKYLTVV